MSSRGLRKLGRSGLQVSPLCLGAMNFGNEQFGCDEETSIGIINAYLDGGHNFIDTANVYSGTKSETIVGKAVKSRRDNVVIATKAASPLGPGVFEGGTSRKHLRRAVEDSLRRLDTDYIDLYQMHRPDHHTDIDETLSALSDLVHAGKVRAIGSSTFPAELIVEAQWIADKRGHHRFRTEQPRYSILTRTIEATVLPTAQRYGMGVLTYGPLSSGWLSGRADPTKGHRAAGVGARIFDLTVPANRAKLEAIQQLTQLAAEAGMPLTHLATAFVRSHPAVTSVLIGPRKPEHLDDLLAGADVELGEDILDRIDEIVPPGTELNPADNYFAVPPAIEDKRLRRQ